MRVHTPSGRLAALALIGAASVPGLLGCSTGAEADAATDPAASSAQVRSALIDLYAGTKASADEVSDAECFAGELLGRVTPAELRDGGVLDADYRPVGKAAILDRTAAVAWTEAQMTCTDFVAESTQAQEALTQDLDAEAYAACLDGRLDEGTIRDASVSTLMARFDDPAVRAMSVAQSECAALSVPRP